MNAPTRLVSHYTLPRRGSPRRLGPTGFQLLFCAALLLWVQLAQGGATSTVPVRLGVDNAGSISYHEQIAKRHTWESEAWFQGLKEPGVGYVSTHFWPVSDAGTDELACPGGVHRFDPRMDWLSTELPPADPSPSALASVIYDECEQSLAR